MSVARIFQDKPNEFRIMYPRLPDSRQHVLISSLLFAIDQVKQTNPTARKISLHHVYSHKYYSDEFGEDSEIQNIIIHAIYDEDIPQLVQTYLMSFKNESNEADVEYQFILDNVSKKAIFQRKFDNQQYERLEDDSYTLSHLKVALPSAGFTLVLH